MHIQKLLRFLLPGAALVALPMSMLASITISSVTDHSYQQTTNNPCVIGDPSCNQPSGFTGNTNNTGPGGTYTLTSPTYTATAPFTTYSGNLLPTSFNVGIDDNYATGSGLEVLNYFDVYNCTTGTCVLDAANSYTGPTDLNGSNNGNGYANNVLSGFNLIAGDTYEFQVQVSNDTDGMEQFFVIPNTPVSNTPEPTAAALLGSSMIGIGALIRRRNRAA